jgi:hypothetical protein
VLALSAGRVVLAAALILVAPRTSAEAPDVESALGELEDVSRPLDVSRLESALATLRERMAVGDTAAWQRLRAVIDRNDRPTSVRLGALTVSAEKADLAIARDIRALAERWTSLLSEPLADTGGWTRDRLGQVDLLYQFLDLLAAGKLPVELAGEPPTLEVLKRNFLYAHIDPGKKKQALDVIVQSGAPKALRREIGIEIVTGLPRSEGVSPALGKLLDEEAFPRLRELVRASDKPSNFHFGAAAALAHLGDDGIRDTLLARRAAWSTTDPKAAAILEYFVWQIDVQHPSTKLLDAIGAAHRNSSSARTWALHRALELGLDRTALRSAVLAYADTVQPKIVRGRDGRERKWYPDLSGLKQEALDLGVLKPEDLPEVKLSKIEPTP